ncbi:MAG: hypothetical protein JWP78_1906, partial [Mucilaginibacter sp.]|nr:hypothetical protein [Mucilaginibacter sp.]
YPERWGYLQFSSQPVSSVTFNLPYQEQQKRYLWLIYYRQKQWYKAHHHYAALQELGITSPVSINKKNNVLQLEATQHQFMALITDSENKVTWAINQEGFIQRLTQPDE